MKSAINQLGPSRIAVLKHLHKHGRTTVITLQMHVKSADIRTDIHKLVQRVLIRRVKDVAMDGYAITNAGRALLGVAMPTEQAPSVRICNASSRQTFNPATDTHMGRIGLAMCG